MTEEQEFDKWNKQKKSLHLKPDLVKFYPHKRQVWMAVYGKNIGYEQNGAGDNFFRPILVIKKFNNKMFWIVPLSSKQKQIDFYYNFLDLNDIPAAIILAQLKLVSIKRFYRLMYTLDKQKFEKIIDRLTILLNEN